MKNNRLIKEMKMSPKGKDQLIPPFKSNIRDYSSARSAGKLSSPQGNTTGTRIYFDPPLPFEGRFSIDAEELKEIRYMSSKKPNR